MKLMMRTLAAGPDFVYDAGKEVDITRKLANEFEEFWDRGSGGSGGHEPEGENNSTIEQEQA